MVCQYNDRYCTEGKRVERMHYIVLLAVYTAQEHYNVNSLYCKVTTLFYKYQASDREGHILIISALQGHYHCFFSAA